MLKISLKTFLIGFFVISAGIAIAALANRKPATPTPTPGYCKTGSNWLMLNGAPPANTNIQEVIAHAVKQDIVLDQTVVNMGVSIGICYYPQDSADIEELIRLADQKMYEAKEAGGMCYRIF